MIPKKYLQVVSLLIIVATVYFSFYSLTPTDENLNLTNSKFSTSNAVHHLKEISKEPHYTGSIAHNNVRNYLVSEFKKLGLQVEIQEQVAVNKKWRSATNCRNIVAKIKGSENGKALLLLSHYDSNPHSSLGVSDAASGVVTILEGVSAFLAKNQTPKNDIIICISDAEELGLLGANAFVNHHPWAKDVGLVLNFEARGSGGPSYMLLETNSGNKKLIEAFQEAKTPFPVGNSLMYSIYKMLPNDTDLTVFREDGNIDGFNFAFIGDHFDYHTAQDSFERMDLKSLNHQGTYLVACLNYFANSNLSNLKAEEDFVFFNFPYLGMVYYPFAWVLPMFVICVLIFIVLITIGILKKKLTIIGMLKGFIPLVFSMLFSVFFTYYGWQLLLKIHPQYNDVLHGFTYNGYYYIAMFVSFSLAICFWFYKGFFKKRTGQDLLVAPLIIWLLINGLIVFYLKGAGFFIIPVLLLLVMLAILIFSSLNKDHTLVFTILSIPVLILFVPFIKMFPVGLGLKMLSVASIFTVLLFGFLVPIFKKYTKNNKLMRLFLLIGLMAYVSASLKASYSEDRKQPNSIIYVHDVLKNEAYFATYNTKTDNFTEQYIGTKPIVGSYDTSTYASKYKTKIQLYTKTNIRNLQKPEISIISDTIVNNNRSICLSVKSNRNANRISLMANKPIKFKDLIINNESIANNMQNNFKFEVNTGTIITYYRTSKNEIINIEMIVDKDQKFDIDILETKYDLLSNSLFKFQPRSEIMMPMPFVVNDATLIKTTMKF